MCVYIQRLCKQTLLQRKLHVGRQAFRAPNQVLESSFCRWIAGQRLAQKAGRNRFDSIRSGSVLFEYSWVRFGSVRKIIVPGSTRFGLRFTDASRLGPVRFGSFLCPVPSGSGMKRFGSVRFGSVWPVRFGFLLLPEGCFFADTGSERLALLITNNSDNHNDTTTTTTTTTYDKYCYYYYHHYYYYYYYYYYCYDLLLLLLLLLRQQLLLLLLLLRLLLLSLDLAVGSRRGRLLHRLRPRLLLLLFVL